MQRIALTSLASWAGRHGTVSSPVECRAMLAAPPVPYTPRLPSNEYRKAVGESRIADKITPPYKWFAV